MRETYQDLGRASMRPGQEAPDEEAFPFGGGLPSPASMRPGQEAPDEVDQHQRDRFPRADASMRPGQEAPDEEVAVRMVLPAPVGFNEAGARSPG